jgi:hypothetical protein
MKCARNKVSRPALVERKKKEHPKCNLGMYASPSFYELASPYGL